MPQELPGFYFDAEKNRYFPIKGPIPGSKSKPSSSSSTPTPTPTRRRPVSSRTSILLEARELNGNPLWLKHAKCKFQDEFLKIRASRPQVWAFHGTDKIADGALEQMRLSIMTPEGQTATVGLLAGGRNGSLRQRLHDVASFHCTIWTADCSSNGCRAIVGTNLGAALVNLESGVVSWVCRGKSDVLTLQFDQSGNIALCGFRNGAIVTVDVRESQAVSSSRLISHQIPSSPSERFHGHSQKQWFKINLYDHRQIKKGPVQSYEGQVNSHTRTQLGTDPSEKFLLSGGEDFYMRLWNIKSGKLLFEDRFSTSVPLVSCCQLTERYPSELDGRQTHMGYSHGQHESWGSWVGSRDGLYYVQWY